MDSRIAFQKDIPSKKTIEEIDHLLELIDRGGGEYVQSMQSITIPSTAAAVNQWGAPVSRVIDVQAIPSHTITHAPVDLPDIRGPRGGTVSYRDLLNYARMHKKANEILRHKVAPSRQDGSLLYRVYCLATRIAAEVRLCGASIDDFAIIYNEERGEVTLRCSARTETGRVACVQECFDREVLVETRIPFEEEFLNKIRHLLRSNQL